MIGVIRITNSYMFILFYLNCREDIKPGATVVALLAFVPRPALPSQKSMCCYISLQ